MRSLVALANEGHAPAQIALARQLARKKSKENLLNAFRWYRRAAQQGDPKHQMEAGFALYRRGISSRATKEGFALLIMAAKRGVVDAQYAVAVELATGETVKKDLRRAASWYRKAAIAGHGEAQYNLALLYFYGEGVNKSIKEHRRWLEKAARRRDLLALQRLYEAHRDGSFGYIRDLRKAKYWGERYVRAGG